MAKRSCPPSRCRQNLLIRIERSNETKFGEDQGFTGSSVASSAPAPASARTQLLRGQIPDSGGTARSRQGTARQSATGKPRRVDDTGRAFRPDQNPDRLSQRTAARAGADQKRPDADL